MHCSRLQACLWEAMQTCYEKESSYHLSCIKSSRELITISNTEVHYELKNLNLEWWEGFKNSRFYWIKRYLNQSCPIKKTRRRYTAMASAKRIPYRMKEHLVSVSPSISKKALRLQETCLTTRLAEPANGEYCEDIPNTQNFARIEEVSKPRHIEPYAWMPQVPPTVATGNWCTEEFTRRKLILTRQIWEQ